MSRRRGTTLSGPCTTFRPARGRPNICRNCKKPESKHRAAEENEDTAAQHGPDPEEERKKEELAALARKMKEDEQAQESKQNSDDSQQVDAKAEVEEEERKRQAEAAEEEERKRQAEAAEEEERKRQAEAAEEEERKRQAEAAEKAAAEEEERKRQAEAAEEEERKRQAEAAEEEERKRQAEAAEKAAAEEEERKRQAEAAEEEERKRQAEAAEEEERKRQAEAAEKAAAEEESSQRGAKESLQQRRRQKKEVAQDSHSSAPSTVLSSNSRSPRARSGSMQAKKPVAKKPSVQFNLDGNTTTTYVPHKDADSSRQPGSRGQSHASSKQKKERASLIRPRTNTSFGVQGEGNFSQGSRVRSDDPATAERAQALEEQLQDVQEQNLKLMARLRQAETKAVDARVALQALETEHNHTLARLTEPDPLSAQKIAKLEEKVRELEEEADAKDLQIGRLNADISSLRVENQSKSAMGSGSAQELEQLRSDNKRLQEELSHAVYDATVADDEILSLQALNEDLNDQLRRVQAQLMEARAAVYGNSTANILNKAKPQRHILTLDGGDDLGLSSGSDPTRTVTLGGFTGLNESTETDGLFLSDDIEDFGDSTVDDELSLPLHPSLLAPQKPSLPKDAQRTGASRANGVNRGAGMHQDPHGHRGQQRQSAARGDQMVTGRAPPGAARNGGMRAQGSRNGVPQSRQAHQQQQQQQQQRQQFRQYHLQQQQQQMRRGVPNGPNGPYQRAAAQRRGPAPSPQKESWLSVKLKEWGF